MKKTILLLLAATLLSAACDGGDTGTTPVERQPVARVDVTAPATDIDAGATLQLTATPRSPGGAPLTDRAVTWASSAEAVATVSATGLVSAHAEGTAVITATSEGRSGGTTLTVRAVFRPVAAVEIRPAGDITLHPGSSRQLAALTLAADGTELTGRVVTWTSSNEAVARISAEGVLEARAAGDAEITATSEGKTARTRVHVPSLVVGVEVTPPGGVIAVGEVLQIRAQPRGAGNVALSRPVTWASSNPAVAVVDDSGRVTGRGIGQTVITATSEGKTGSAYVAVSTWSTRALLTVGGAALPTTLFAYTEALPGGGTRNVHYQVTEGFFRMMGGRFELLVNGWYFSGNQVAVQAALGASGAVYYDFADGSYIFSSGPAHVFRGRILPDGRLSVTWRAHPNAPEATLVFAAAP